MQHVEAEESSSNLRDRDEPLGDAPHRLGGVLANGVATFSRIERALLLREVKLLRYVDTEYLPSLAEVCVEALVPRGGTVCAQDQPTNGALIIVAHGCLQLRRHGADGTVTGRHLRAGDSIGNTALIEDHFWQYTGRALEDTWTLSISRPELTDLLRGRADLAHAVLFGVYHTFARRLRQVMEQGLSLKQDFLFAADVDKHTASPHVGPSSRSGEWGEPQPRLAARTDSFRIEAADV